MPFDPAELHTAPNRLAEHYRRFRVSERLLLTGHSHQAWPDAAFDGHQEAWLDAARHVDRKWEPAFAKAERVRRGFRELLDDPDGLYSLSANTHDLLVRFLSALPLGRRPKLVTTDGEFHSLRRQLDRLAEEGVEVERVAALPAETVGERLAEATSDRTAAVLVSTVFFRNAHIAGDLTAAAEACRRHGAELLLDLYHQLDAVPFSLRRRGLEDAFAVGGGYKYCQMGEGNCFLRFPPDCRLRPAVTGWFAEFEELADDAEEHRVTYDRGDDRFAGATYDPTSHYRAAAVLDFFAELALTPEFLRRVSRHQIERLARGFDALDLDPELLRRDRNMPLDAIGGFLALESPHAGEISRGLLERGVLTDFRDQLLRLGPAPYLADGQLDDAIGLLQEVARSL